MQFIADVMLAVAALSAGCYCLVLSRKLTRFTDLENGMGGAIAVLSQQVDEMTRALVDAQGVASGSSEALERLTARADEVAQRLELMVAALHDMPEPEKSPRRDQTEEASAPSGPTLFRTRRSAALEAAE